jgi:hypothetical protein
MFKLNPTPQFAAPVSLTVPGQAETGSVMLTFQHMGKQALADWLASAGQGKNDLDLVAQVVVGWEGVSDDDGAAVPFSREALAALLDAYPAAAGEIVSAYVHVLAESRAKN